MDSKEDEEISIDFGKIKNFFKSKKEGREESKAEDHPAAEKKEDEDIDLSFDFSRVKKFFSPEKDSGESGDDININWGRVIGFFKKYGVVLIALLPIILSIYIRMLAGSLLFADDWASNSVINGVRSQIAASVSQQYPNLPDANKNAIIDTELQKVLNQNKAQIDGQIKATSAYFKSFFEDENGKNYMPDIDPYYWFRYVKNIVEHGYSGDILKDGRSFDTHQLAPLGRFVTPDMFHIYFLAYFYKAMHLLVPSITIMRSMFYYPVFVSALSALLVFLIARKIAGNLGGLFAGLMMAINAAFLGRTLFGHADSDAWVVFFPLLVTWLFVATIDAKSLLKVAIITAIAGFFTGMYSFAWNGWWNIFDFLLATIAVTFLYLVLVNFKDIKAKMHFVLHNTALRNLVIVGIIYFLSTAVFVSLFSGWHSFRTSFGGPLGFSSIKAPVEVDLWPNVLTTVAELNEGSIDGIINSVGGKFLFFISLLGLVLSISRTEGIKKFDYAYIIGSAFFYGSYFIFRRVGLDVSVIGLLIWIMLPVLLRIAISIYKKDSSYDFKLSILLSFWIASTIFASIKGIRFTLLLAPAFSVAFGVALGKIYIYASRILAKELKIHKVIGSGILIVLLLLLYVNPARGSINAAKSDIPLINDAWYNSLNAIKQSSSKDAIITSWWDFGHHFKALTDRRVTFDGTTQTSPAAHWVGKLLMIGDEKQSIGMLRMLDCGHNRGYDTLHKINNDTHKSVKILNEIIILNKAEAYKKLLGYGLTKQQAEDVLSYTHCDPPDAYFIASEDMIGKSGVWSHFGSWSFEKADIWFNARKLPQENAVDYMMKKFSYTKEKAENTYFEVEAITSDSQANTWIAPWPGYGGTIICSKNDKGIFVCGNGLQINLSSYDIFGTTQQGVVRPKVAAFTTKEGILKKDFNGTTLDFGMTIVPKNENELEIILSSKELAGSMFTRMFYMQGHGLSYFKLFDHQKGLTGTDIYVYKIDWQGANTTITQGYVDTLKKIKEEGTARTALMQNNTNIAIANISLNENK